MQLAGIEQGFQSHGIGQGLRLGHRHGRHCRPRLYGLFQQTAQDIGSTLADVPGLAGDKEVEIVIKLDGFHRDALDSSKFGCGDYT